MSGTIRTWSPPHSAVERLRLFALHGTEVLGEKIARSLGCHLAALEERSFEDGEHKSRPLDTVAGCDVYVVHSLHGGPQESPNDKLCRLLFFIGALKDAGAARVTAVMPYLCYARKDRRTKAQDPVTIRYLATLFEAAGVDTVVTLEVHNEAAFENAFRCPSVALSAAPLLIGNIREIAADRPICVVSPDLADFAIDRIIATDSVPAFRLPPGPVLAKLEIISAAPLFAETIRRLHHNETLADLLLYQR